MKKKEKSIKKSVVYTFISLFIIIASIFYTSFFMKNLLIKEYDKSMQVSLVISRLSFELNNYAVLFDRYTRNKDKDIFLEYNSSKEEIRNSINIVKLKIVDVQSLIFLRNFKNMFEYQVKMADEIMSNNILNKEKYEKITKAKTLFAYMNKHMQMLSVAHLNYSSKKYSNLLKNYKIMENNLYTVLSILTIIIFIFVIKKLRGILSTLNNLSTSAKLLSDTHWEIPDIENSYYKELDTLGNAFNTMKNNIRIFIEELEQKSELEINLNKARINNIEKDKLLKESQLRTLQAQMDPHFLFNTLNTISRIAMFENAQTSVKLIESISKILRYNLEHMGKKVSLKKEIIALKAYALIQETRFQEQLKFQFDIEENLLDEFIPPMLIQPIMENSIIHGLYNKRKNGKINIHIKKEKNMIKVEVYDNGKGITEDEISSIFFENSKKNINKDRTGIGLNNIKKMLKLNFDIDDLLQIKSIVGKETTVSIFIPIERN